jgi:L-aspartate oxidase
MSEAFDVIVVGSGAAGLAVALGARGVRVALVTRGVFGLDGASCWAQGGIAAALGPGDSPAQHALDTVNAGTKLCNRTAVRWLAESAPETIAWLHSYGVQFDHYAGRLALGREAAHSFPRIVHAGGDATGAELMRALREATQRASHVRLFEYCEVEKLLTASRQVVGVMARTARGERFQLNAPHTVLASGGLGQIYRYTTNPIECDGSGLAMAHSAGAELGDLEFMQFTPTALAIRPDSRGEPEQLSEITGALRGAGARLLNENGRRIMAGVHELLELAPDDVVARAVWDQIEAGQRVFLDARGLGDAVRLRFPTAYGACLTQNIDPRRDLIPVVPAAQFHLGGVRVDLHGQSTMRGLYAVGEVACTGAHGASRLASNGLLEAVSFGRALGQRLASVPATHALLQAENLDFQSPRPAPVNDAMVLGRLKNLMWSYAGILRTPEGLRGALDQFDLLEKRCLDGSRVLMQLRVAKLMCQAALKRSTSVGAHQLIPEAAKRSASAWNAVA